MTCPMCLQLADRLHLASQVIGKCAETNGTVAALHEERQRTLRAVEVLRRFPCWASQEALKVLEGRDGVC